jgi:hypothetical protein
MCIKSEAQMLGNNTTEATQAQRCPRGRGSFDESYIIAIDNLVWSNDSPHDQDEKRRMMRDNARDLYKYRSVM